MIDEALFSHEESSFRDPSSKVFYYNNEPYRIIYKDYVPIFQHFIDCGLYEELLKCQLIIPFEILTDSDSQNFPIYVPGSKIIKPLQIHFISYSYEWSFSQFKDAALLTLEVNRKSLEFGMVLKDASSYNIQFHYNKPVFIDICSFDYYRENKIWHPYKQFCQHFLGPLALASYVDIRLLQLLKSNIDGLALEFCSKLLPVRTYLNLGLVLHLHTHSKTLSSKSSTTKKEFLLSRTKLNSLLENLTDTILGLNWKPGKSQWGEYYGMTNYTNKSFSEKNRLVQDLIKKIKVKTAWDIGANSGIFSQILSSNNIPTISFDIDYAAVEKNYNTVKCSEHNVLPLVIDFCNPSPGIGWENLERKTLVSRGTPDLILALAIIHHLVITNNLSFDQVAKYFASNCSYLIIEYVPKEDSQTQIILGNKADIFGFYTEQNFLNAFKIYFSEIEMHHIEGTIRKLYLFKRDAQ